MSSKTKLAIQLITALDLFLGEAAGDTDLESVYRQADQTLSQLREVVAQKWKPPEVTDEQLLELCDRPFECYDFSQPITLRWWVFQTITKLFYETEGFSGKRPHGNSGWDYYLYRPFIDAGLITEPFTDDQEQFANDLIVRAFALMLNCKDVEVL